jgi:hypothetical protein
MDIRKPYAIGTLIRCKRCVEEAAGGEVTESLVIGFTESGLQLWCKRHECQVAYIPVTIDRNAGSH